MPFIAQNGEITVTVPAGQKIAISSYGGGDAIVYYKNQPSTNAPMFYEATRIRDTMVVLGTFTADRDIKISAGPTSQVEYVIAANPAVSNQAFDPTNTIFISLNNTTSMAFTAPIFAGTNNINQFTQLANQNKSTGASASADMICYSSNNTNDITGFVDIGCCGANFTDAAYAVTLGGDAYLFGSAVSGAGKRGNLIIATDNTGSRNDIELCTNGFGNAANRRLRVKKEGQCNLVPLAADPANPEKGDIYFNSTTNKLKVYSGSAWETVTSV